MRFVLMGFLGLLGIFGWIVITAEGESVNGATGSTAFDDDFSSSTELDDDTSPNSSMFEDDDSPARGMWDVTSMYYSLMHDDSIDGFDDDVFSSSSSDLFDDSMSSSSFSSFDD